MNFEKQVCFTLHDKNAFLDSLLHLQVTGELLDDLSSWDALRAALPVGTVSGAPKVFFPPLSHSSSHSSAHSRLFDRRRSLGASPYDKDRKWRMRFYSSFKILMVYCYSRW